MRGSIDKWRKTFWIAMATLGMSLLASELGSGALSAYVGVAAALIGCVSFVRLFLSPWSRQPRVH